MKGQKAGRIGIVVADETLRAAQRVNGKLVTAGVPIGKDFKKSLRQLLTSSPFVGRDVAVGLEGGSVLIESLVIPAGSSKSARAVCAERLKGDPVFHEEAAVLGVAVGQPAGGTGPSMVILAAVDKQRIGMIMESCRELELRVHAVEAAALAAWRAWDAEGLQVRLLRTRKADVVMAGQDGKPLFCRIVDAPISGVELRATIGRAASLLGTGSFDALTTSGVEHAEMAQLANDLQMKVQEPEGELTDAAAQGVAADGSILTEFTPPEERTLRQKRRARKLSVSLAAVSLAVVLSAGVLSMERLSGLETRKEALENQKHLADQLHMQLVQQQGELARLEANAVRLKSARPGHLMSRLWEIVMNAAPVNVQFDTMHVTDVEHREQAPAKRGQPAPPPVITRALQIQVNGLAADASGAQDYVDALLETGAFTDVRLEGSERVLLGNGSEGERFRLSAHAETR